MPTIETIFTANSSAINSAIENISRNITAMSGATQAKFSAMSSAINDSFATVSGKINDSFLSSAGNASLVLESAKKAFSAVAKEIEPSLAPLADAFSRAKSSFFEPFNREFSATFSAGAKLLDNNAESVKAFGSALAELAKGVAPLAAVTIAIAATTKAVKALVASFSLASAGNAYLVAIALAISAAVYAYGKYTEAAREAARAEEDALSRIASAREKLATIKNRDEFDAAKREFKLAESDFFAIENAPNFENAKKQIEEVKKLFSQKFDSVLDAEFSAQRDKIVKEKEAIQRARDEAEQALRAFDRARLAPAERLKLEERETLSAGFYREQAGVVAGVGNVDATKRYLALAEKREQVESALAKIEQEKERAALARSDALENEFKEIELLRARASGNEKLLAQLERERDIVAETARLRASGVDARRARELATEKTDLTFRANNATPQRFDARASDTGLSAIQTSQASIGGGRTIDLGGISAQISLAREQLAASRASLSALQKIAKNTENAGAQGAILG